MAARDRVSYPRHGPGSDPESSPRGLPWLPPWEPGCGLVPVSSLIYGLGPANPRVLPFFISVILGFNEISRPGEVTLVAQTTSPDTSPGTERPYRDRKTPLRRASGAKNFRAFRGESTRKSRLDGRPGWPRAASRDSSPVPSPRPESLAWPLGRPGRARVSRVETDRPVSSPGEATRVAPGGLCRPVPGSFVPHRDPGVASRHQVGVGVPPYRAQSPVGRDPRAYRPPSRSTSASLSRSKSRRSRPESVQDRII